MLAVRKTAGGLSSGVAFIYNLRVGDYGGYRLLYDNAFANGAFFALCKPCFRAGGECMRYGFKRMLCEGKRFYIESAAIAVRSFLARLIARGG
jgi:hypothetical protein